MLRDPATKRLVRLELRRARPVVGHTALLGASALVVLGLVGWLTPARTAWILFVCALAAPWSLPANVLRDRLEGGLEFLQALPISATRLAGARLVAAALFALPAGVAAGGIRILLRGPGVGPGLLPALLPALGTFAVATLVVAVVTALATGIALRLGARAFANGLGAAFVAVIATHHLTHRFAPWLAPAILEVLRRVSTARLLWAGGPVVAVGLGFLAFHLARTGFERFTPGRDRVTW